MPVAGFKSAEIPSSEIQKLVDEALGFKKPPKNSGSKTTKKANNKAAKKPAKKAAKKPTKKPAKKNRRKETLGLNYG